MLALSHRVAVMSDHRFVAEYRAADIDEAGILLRRLERPTEESTQ